MSFLSSLLGPYFYFFGLNIHCFTCLMHMFTNSNDYLARRSEVLLRLASGPRCGESSICLRFELWTVSLSHHLISFSFSGPMFGIWDHMTLTLSLYLLFLSVNWEIYTNYKGREMRVILGSQNTCAALWMEVVHHQKYLGHPPFRLCRHNKRCPWMKNYIWSETFGVSD